MKFNRIAMSGLLVAMAAVIATGGCAIINQGEVGLKKVWGEIDPEPLEPGIWPIEVVSTDVVRVPIRTTSKTVDFVLPSKEGLNVQARMSILYRIKPERAADVIGQVGEDYEESLIAPVFRSQAADVSARFFAKDMYSAERRSIEKAIGEALAAILDDRGFVIEAVLMKSISLPPGLTAAIEQKLEAEQLAEQMRFTIDRERLNADRKRIEAEGERDAQRILSEGLTDQVLRLRAIEAFRALADSPNAKVIITDGQTPLFIDGDKGGGQ